MITKFTNWSQSLLKVVVELSPKEHKVLTEVHDFLFQELSFKGFMDILKIGNDK